MSSRRERRVASRQEGKPLSVASESASPFVDYVLGLAGPLCGVAFDRVEVGANEYVDVYHGNDQHRRCALRIPLTASYTPETVPRPAVSSQDGDARDSRAPLPFDLFAAIRFWLADEGNEGLAGRTYDRHGRLVAAGSAQDIAGAVDTPLVNIYLLVLRKWLKVRLGVVPRRHLPAGKRCVLVLSHDVDRPLDPLDIWPTLSLAARATISQRRISHARSGAVAVGKAGAALLGDRRGRNWIFADLAEAEAARGFRSTFFFAPTSRFSQVGSYFDVEYELRQPRFRLVTRMLVERGFEIGLHVGYTTGGDVERLRCEKTALEDVAGAEVIGSRHHYWRVGRTPWRALEAHARAGLRYDSSTSFAGAHGYRLGIGLPFRPWNPTTESPIECVQIPTMLMDGAFFYRRDHTVEDAVARFETLLATLKECEGTAALDWHQETSLPLSNRFRPWGEAYLRILDVLAADSEVSVQTCAEAAALS